MPSANPNLIKIPIPSPDKGVMRTPNYEAPVPGSLQNGLNVLPYDLNGRKQLAQRYGTTTLYNLNTIGANGTNVQGMLAVGSIVQPGAIISPAPDIEINSTNFVPFSTLFSTSGNFLVNPGGPVSTSFDPGMGTSVATGLTMTFKTLSAISTFLSGTGPVIQNIDWNQSFEISSTFGATASWSAAFSLYTTHATTTYDVFGITLPSSPAGEDGTLFLFAQVTPNIGILSPAVLVASTNYSSPSVATISGSADFQQQFTFPSNAHGDVNWSQTGLINSTVQGTEVLEVSDFTNVSSTISTSLSGAVTSLNVLYTVSVQ